MQLPLTVDVIAALGIGAAVLVVLVVLVLVLRRRRTTDGAPEPSPADWTGEIAGADAPPPRRTVAEVVAGRDADTTPMPISSSALLARRSEPVARPARAPAGEEGAEQPSAAEAAPVAEPAGAEPAAAELPVDPAAAAEPAAEPAEEPAGDLGRTGEAEPAPDADRPAQPASAEPELAVAGQQPEEPIAADSRPTGEHPDAALPADRPAADRIGSGRTVAAAVAQAFAVRAAAARPPEPSPAAPMPRGDARDRLLAVLLEDPVRAVGAAQELEACRGQLDRLSDALRHERGVLSDVLSRLADTGLRHEQLARLAGLPLDEVYALVVPDPARRR